MFTIAGLDYAPYTMVCNGRFKGGYITRAFGKPEINYHAIQLELSQFTYMNEQAMTYNETLAVQVQPKLETLVKTLIAFASAENANKSVTNS